MNGKLVPLWAPKKYLPCFECPHARPAIRTILSITRCSLASEVFVGKLDGLFLARTSAFTGHQLQFSMLPWAG